MADHEDTRGVAEGRDEFDNVCSEVVEGVFRGPHWVVCVTIPSVEREKLIIKGVVYNIFDIFFINFMGGILLYMSMQ